jgi:hypothetical protein
MNWELVNKVKRSADPLSCNLLSLPKSEFLYIVDILDTPISSLIDKILESSCPESEKKALLVEYINCRPKFLYKVPQTLQTKEMVMTGAREARSYHGPGSFLNCVSPEYIDKDLKLVLIEQGYLNIFLEENVADPGSDYTRSLYKALIDCFKYHYSSTRQFLDIIGKIDYSLFNSDQIHSLTKSSMEFFDYIPISLIPENAIIDHVNRYKTTSKLRGKIDRGLYQKALKIELLHHNLPAHPKGLVRLITKIKKANLVDIISEFFKTYDVQDVVQLATTDKQLYELAKIYGFESSPRFSGLSKKSKRLLLEDDLEL